MQMIDIHLPTTDGQHIVLRRYTEPEPDVALLLAQLQLALPRTIPTESPRLGQSSRVVPT